MTTNPTPIIELFRGNHATEILAAAVSHFGVFDVLSAGARSLRDLGTEIGLDHRPAMVLVTALRAMQLIAVDSQNRLEPTALAREHLVRGTPLFIGDYIGLGAKNPGVVEFVERLRSNRPAGADKQSAGTAFIYREGTESAMEHEASARHLTLALAGRARNVAPVLAERLALPEARHLLDVGGGTGIYSIELLRRNPHLRATLWDRAEVLKVAKEIAADAGVHGRLNFVAGDMFMDPVPAECDTVLLSNVLHDWNEPDCRALIRRCAAPLAAGGVVLIHDVFLNDALDGPLPVALYSAALFALTEGRAYSGHEYQEMLRAADLVAGPVLPTHMHCGVMKGTKR